jgi:hypothetical protein
MNSVNLQDKTSIEMIDHTSIPITQNANSNYKIRSFLKLPSPPSSKHIHKNKVLAIFLVPPSVNFKDANSIISSINKIFNDEETITVFLLC